MAKSSWTNAKCQSRPNTVRARPQIITCEVQLLNYHHSFTHRAACSTFFFIWFCETVLRVTTRAERSLFPSCVVINFKYWCPVMKEPTTHFSRFALATLVCFLIHATGRHSRCALVAPLFLALVRRHLWQVVGKQAKKNRYIFCCVEQ